MSQRRILRQLGLLLVVLSILLGATGSWSAWQVATGDDSERHAMLAFLASAGLGLLLGGGLVFLTRGKKSAVGRREALLLVAVSWIVGAQLCALPYLIWAHLGGDPPEHPFRSNVNCYFEAMSGLTTTGATILSDIASLPRSILLWRALTHWLGGLGIVVLFVAVLPLLGAGGKRLYRVEAPGPSPEGVRPHIRETARILWFLYMGLTGMQIVALWLAGLDWFDASCHTFATLATGGFSTRNGSVAEIDSVAVEAVILVFMVLAGVNFGLYYQFIRGRLRSVWRDVELRVYLALLFIGSSIVSLSLYFRPLPLVTGETVGPDGLEAIRQGVFTTVSIQTTTGFCTGDFDTWPFIAQAVLILLMFVGGCGGSTSGGIKVIRVWIAIKVMLSEIEHAFRPNVVRPVKVGGAALDPELRLATVAYVLGIVLLFVLGSGLIMVLEPPDSTVDFTSASTASIATLCTIGPGLAKVGASQNYGWFADSSKIVMTVLMLFGRLEVFAVIVLFSPRFWKGD